MFSIASARVHEDANVSATMQLITNDAKRDVDMRLLLPPVLEQGLCRFSIGIFLADLVGFFCDGSLSITLVMAQRLVPGRIGVASGVILGLGFVTGRIGVPITGRIADLFGMQVALASLTVLLAIGSLVALTIPTGSETARESTVDPAAVRVDIPAPSAARR